MKTEFIDVSDTKKNLVVEIQSTVVDAEIDKVSRDYSRAARIPGFRPGQGAGEGRPAAVPRSDPARRRARPDPARRRRSAARARRRAGRHAGHPRRRRRRRPAAQVHGDVRDGAADRAGRLLRASRCGGSRSASRTARSTRRSRSCASARRATSRSRTAASRSGDSVLMDLVRTAANAGRGDASDDESDDAEQTGSQHENVTVDIGGQANPPGFDEALIGLSTRARARRSTCSIPADYSIKELAGTTVQVRRRRSRRSASASCRSWTTSSPRTSASSSRSTRCATRVRADLEHEATHEAEREMRAELLKQLATRVQFDVPASLLDREIDRRVEEFVRRLIEQQIDPDADQHQLGRVPRAPEGGGERSGQERAGPGRGGAARGASPSPDSEVEAEVQRYAERTGRSAAAVRARLEKEGGLGRLYSGLRREKTVDFLLSQGDRSLKTVELPPIRGHSPFCVRREKVGSVQRRCGTLC